MAVFGQLYSLAPLFLALSSTAQTSQPEDTVADGVCMASKGGAHCDGLVRDYGLSGVRLDLKKDKDEAAYLKLGAVNSTLLAQLRALLTSDMWSEEAEERENAILKGRRKKFYGDRPGVTTIRLIYSDMHLTQFFEFPWWKKFGPIILPILRDVFKQYGLDPDRHIIRVQLNRVEPEGEIRQHVDQGIWATNSHRVHVPVFVSDGCAFHMRRTGKGRAAGERPLPWRTLAMQEGYAYELNNRWQHRVRNHGSGDRVHLLVDWIDQEYPERQQLTPGQVCHEQGLLEGFGCKDMTDDEFSRALQDRARRSGKPGPPQHKPGPTVGKPSDTAAPKAGKKGRKRADSEL